MNHETQQPYFTIRVTRCWECPHSKHAMCGLEPFEKYGRFLENCDGLTPSCPMWPQVQQEKKMLDPGSDHTAFAYGDYVRKKSGSAWSGRVVGWYTTKLTPEGYAVESDAHPGSVQIYPASALEPLPEPSKD